MASGAFEKMKAAFAAHPYIILGGGGLVALYFLWPRSSSQPQQASSGSSDYAAQLGSATQLAAMQMATQAQTAQNANTNATALSMAQLSATAAEQTALFQAQGASNVAIAQSNAAAAVASQQAQASETQSMSVERATSFGALMGALSSFGAQGVAVQQAQTQQVDTLLSTLGGQGIVAAQANLPMWLTELTGGGSLSGGQSNSTWANAQSASSASATATTGATGSWSSHYSGWFSAPTYTWNPPTPSSSSSTASQSQSSASGSSQLYNFTATPGPNAFNPNLLGSLWEKALATYASLPQVQGYTPPTAITPPLSIH